MATLLVVHGIGICLSLRLGCMLTDRVLKRLRLYNGGTSEESTGPDRAGRTIGYAERFIVYLAVVTGQSVWLVVVFSLKTVVRYPEIQLSRKRSRQDDRSEAGRESKGGPEVARETPDGAFAEYYLAGTLLSLAVGLAVPLLAMQVLDCLAK